MIRLEKQGKLLEMIHNELIEVIRRHGPIENNKQIHSAAKRILGATKAWIFSFNNIREKKLLKDWGWVEAGIQISDEYGSLYIMAIAKGYAMIRRPYAMPFVVSFEDIRKKYKRGISKNNA